jgi:NADH dehydrogenase
LLEGTDVLINLIGILHESKKNQFINIHEGLIKKILKGAKKANVARLIHVSALKCDTPGKSKYLFSKFRGEKAVTTIFRNKAWTILRPSIIYGSNDKFLNLFIKLIKFLPVILLISPKAKFQPIDVDDFVDILIKVIDSKKSYQKALNIAGPKIFTFLEIIKEIKNSLNKKNIIIPLNKKLTLFFVRILELSPVKLVTRDNLKSMEIDNTAKINDSYQYKSSLRQLSSYLKKYSG